MNGERKNLQLVKVFVRQRPFTQDELELRRPSIVKSTTSTEVVIKSGPVEKIYKFDRVFQPSCTQAQVYDVVVSPLINLVLSGYTCTVFAYGQTGTGKTHTMIGQNIALNINCIKDPTVGVIPRAAIHIFDELTNLNVDYSVRVSFVEIYNEEVRDLLVSDSIPLRIYDDPDTKGSTCIRGLTERHVKNTQDVYDLLNIGAAERQTAATNLNRLSSRSHTIFTIVVNTREITSNGEEVIKTGKLHLIDLAGSENIGRSGATDMRAREAGSINKSLLTLGKVIKALAQKMQHVPYRESKLTRILQDSLGGKSKTCMIATFAPCMDCFDETVSTLDYAHVARSVANCPTMNINKSQTAVFQASQEEVKKLRAELQAARDAEGFYMSHESYEKMNEDIKKKDDRIHILMNQIRLKERYSAEKSTEYDILLMSFQETQSTADNLAQELKQQKNVIKQNGYIERYMDGHLLHLHDTAKTLLNVAEISTELQDVFCRKYGTQCDSTMSNASVTERAIATSFNCLQETNSANDKFYNKAKNQIDHCLKRVDIITENTKSASQELIDLTHRLGSSEEHVNLTFDSFFKDGPYENNKFKSQINSCSDGNTQMLVELLEEQTKKIKSMGQFSQEKRFQVVSLLMDFGNKICEQLGKEEESRAVARHLLGTFHKNIETSDTLRRKRLHHVRRIIALRQQLVQELNARNETFEEELDNAQDMEKTYVKFLTLASEALEPTSNLKASFVKFKEEGQPLFKNSSSFVHTNVKKMEADNENCSKEIDSYELKTAKFFNSFCEATETELDRLHKERKTYLQKCSNELKQICQKLSIEHIAHIETRVKELAYVQETYINDTKRFVQQSSEKLKHLEENLDSKVHAGDTPAKPVYQYPRALKPGLSPKTLREQFETMDEEGEEEFTPTVHVNMVV